MATFATFKTDFIAAYQLQVEGSVVADTSKYLSYESMFAHMFELVERRLKSKFDRETGYTILMPGSGQKVLEVGPSVTDVTKIEYKTSDSDATYTEYSTDNWEFIEKDAKVYAYDFGEPFYYYNVVGGNTQITVDIGYATWADFPTKLQYDMINIARSYIRMTDDVDVDGDGESGMNFEILNKAIVQWRPAIKNVSVLLPK